jgi:hypothetical protein
MVNRTGTSVQLDTANGPVEVIRSQENELTKLIYDHREALACVLLLIQLCRDCQFFNGDLSGPPFLNGYPLDEVLFKCRKVWSQPAISTVGGHSTRLPNTFRQSLLFWRVKVHKHRQAAPI